MMGADSRHHPDVRPHMVRSVAMGKDHSGQQPAGPGRLTNLWHAVGLGFWHLIFRGLNRVEVRGAEWIPQPGTAGVAFLYNHISAIDPFLVAATAMPFFSSVWWRAPAKAELFNYPVIRSILRTWGAFPVHRGQRDFAAIQRMAKMLGDSVLVIAPEGRRSRDGRLQPGRTGVGKILYDARPRLVIPVAMAGTDRILPIGSVLPRIGRRSVIAYGRPINLEPFYRLPDSVETSHKIVDRVIGAIAELKKTLG